MWFITIVYFNELELTFTEILNEIILNTIRFILSQHWSDTIFTKHLPIAPTKQNVGRIWIIWMRIPWSFSESILLKQHDSIDDTGMWILTIAVKHVSKYMITSFVSIQKPWWTNYTYEASLNRYFGLSLQLYFDVLIFLNQDKET